MKLTVTNLIISCLLGSLTPAIGQDFLKAKSGKVISLKVFGARPPSKYLGENRGDYATIKEEAGDYIFEGNGTALENGKSYKIKTGDMYLYETAKGNAGLYKTKNDTASTWKIEKVMKYSAVQDEFIRHGDTIQLSNGYWTDNYLNDYGEGFAAVGTYDKPRNWVVEFALPQAQKKFVSNRDEKIYQTLYIDNRGGPAAAGAKLTLTLSKEDEVRVNNGKSDNWSANFSVTAGITQGTVPGSPSANFSVTAGAEFGQNLTSEKERIEKITQGKSIETSYDRPVDGEVILYSELLVPYETMNLSYQGTDTGVEPINMRTLNGSIKLSQLKAVYLPSFDRGGNRIAANYFDLMRAFDILDESNADLANELRRSRLQEWKQKGWLGDASRFHTRVLSKAEMMIVKQKYWSENNQFYAIFQDDGNLVVYTKDGGYVWDIFTKGKLGSPLKAKILKLDRDGSLVLADANNTKLWSSEIRVAPVPNSTLNLSNSGDILMLDPGGAVLWSSRQ